ncbi:sensor histidine kinase [Gemmobacter sp.]|uniref:sensor histidine kinase n=1 Tax=Gemmobacter sp. TaxID=1898957 RepID=UPI002AFE026E|nr:ATP-binding protein [Gemmobacter sp.]
MLRWLMSPIVLPLAALMAGLAIATLTLAMAISQPWLGLTLGPAPDGAMAQVLAVAPDGPAERAGIKPGARPTAVNRAPLDAGDLIEEPDMLDNFPAFERFIARQGQLARTLRDPGGVVMTVQDSAPATIEPASWRPFWSLPAAFWAQLLVGLFGFVAGSLVLGIQRSRAAAFLWVAGVGLMMSADAAAVYSSRELALPGTMFRLLSAGNHLGALLFGAGMVGLFLCYPARLVAPRWQVLPGVALVLWWGANQMRLLPSPAIGFQLPVVLALIGIAACVVLQFRATRRDPRARAALRWLGLAVLIGAGAFVMTIIVPSLLGFETPLSQGFAFLFFLPIYGGLALGVARYRLFELEDWAFRILFYMSGMVLLLALDAALIALIAMERAPAFGLSLLAVCLLYLPLRDGLGRRLLRRRGDLSGALFRAITDVALTPPGASRRERWQALLTTSFDPLRIEPLDQPPPAPRLADDGAALDIPAVDSLPPLRLMWARGGRALFSPHDLARAREMVTMLDQAAASRRAYETGVAEERARIAQDMHDNIGIQLMGALHSGSAARKDALIRETLSDLRDIISNANRADLGLDELLADLRATLGEHLSAVGIALDWDVTGNGPARLPPRLAHALRSILREAVSNALRHSGATRVQVRVQMADDRLHLSVEDDGRGLGAAMPSSGGGNGLANMRTRAAGLGGDVAILPAPGGGTRIEAVLPVAQMGKAA